MAAFQCPLSDRSRGNTEMDIAFVNEIEDHVSSGFCPHPDLKDLVLHGPGLDGMTPLLLALDEEERLDSVKHIIENWKVNVEQAGSSYHPWGEIGGATPLFVAALNDHVESVRYLLNKGADVSAKTTTGNLEFDGLTPLDGVIKLACYRDNLEGTITIARLLLEAEADPYPLKKSFMMVDRDGRGMLSYKFFKMISGLPIVLLDKDIRECLSLSPALRQGDGTLLCESFRAGRFRYFSPSAPSRSRPKCYWKPSWSSELENK